MKIFVCYRASATRIRVFLLLLLCSCSLLFNSRPSYATETVVVYTSVDQVFSEPILKLFEQRTGIEVKAVYDVEAAKTVGLVNRLLAERKRPRADVFWNSEIVRTIVLQEKNVLAPYFSKKRNEIPEQFKDKDGYWTGFSCRARVLIYNTNMLSADEAPQSIFDLAKPEWRNKAAMANPLFGTTASHVGALYSVLGKEKTEEYLLSLQRNNILVVNGNSVVRDVVAAGEVPVGITDSDDVQVGISLKKPVAMLYPDQNEDGLGTFIIPNSVALIQNAPHPEQGKKLIDFLLSHEVEQLQAQSESANIPVRKPPSLSDNKKITLSSLKVMPVQYRAAAHSVRDADHFSRRLFSK